MRYLIEPDPDALKPESFGTLAIMGFGGDELPDPDSRPYRDRETIWLPVYRFEHSGVAYSTKPFSCPWDSCLTGYIYVPLSRVREEFKVQRVSKHLQARVLDILRSEVETFSYWANGDVYGYIIPETDDSCWGFYGYEQAVEAALEALH